MIISRQKQRAVKEAKARDKKTARIMATKAARDLAAVTNQSMYNQCISTYF